MSEELTLVNGKGTIGNRRRDQRQVGEKWEVPLFFFGKSPNLAEALAFFSPKRKKTVVKGRFKRNKKTWTGASQRES